jgi:hypothetical protein
MKTSVAIFSKNLELLKEQIPLIKNEFKDYDDFLIFTDSFDSVSIDCSIMSTFYMKFFPGTVIFLNESDYQNNESKILGQCLLWENKS